MGAHDISGFLVGKTLSEAYDKAVEQALYEDGHDRYNGTISTTSGAVLVNLPKGMTYLKFKDYLNKFERWYWDNQDHLSWQPRLYGRGGFYHVAGRPKGKHPVPEARRELIENFFHDVENSKWGPVYAIPVTNREVINRLHVNRGQKVWYYRGLASS